MTTTVKVVERLLSYMSDNNLTKSKVEKTLGVSNGYFNKQLSREGDLGTDLIKKIYEQYPDIDIIWLITGKVTGDNNNMQQGIVGNHLGDNSQIQYGLCQQEVDNLRLLIKEKDEQNALLKEYIATLKETIANQKETIEQYKRT